MQERCKKPDGGSNTPHVLALWDAIGITHELNGFRNDAAGWLKKYGDERELEITAWNAIEGAKKALEKKVHDGWDQTAKNTANLPDTQTTGMRNRAVMQHAKGDPAALGHPLYALDEKTAFRQHHNGAAPGSTHTEVHASLAEEAPRGHPALDNSDFAYALARDGRGDHPLFSSGDSGFYNTVT